MKKVLIGAVAFGALFAIGCDQTVSSEQPGWNAVGATWGDSRIYDDSSDEAASAAAMYAAYSGTHTAVDIGHFSVVLDDVTVNPDGTQTWTYAITKTGSGPDLSHFDLQLGCGLANFADLAADNAGYGPDATCAGAGATGDVVKWDFGFTGAVGYYTLTTDQAYAVGTVNGYAKAGTDCWTGALPGPDCTSPDPGGDPDPDDDCPTWIDTLTLDVSIEYINHHGYTGSGFPIYYVGDTMQGNLEICNNTADNVSGLTVTAIQEKYPSGTLACGSPVQQWTAVSIPANTCLTVLNEFLLDPSCPWGNYRTHVIISREADDDCPFEVTIYEEGEVGVYDPPAGS